MTDKPHLDAGEDVVPYEPDAYEREYMSTGNTLMRERLSMSGVIRWGIPLMLVGIAILELIALPAWYIALPVAAFILLLALFISMMMTLRVNLSPERLHIQTGLFGPKIAVKDIVSCEPVNYNAIREYGGWGIRIGRDGTVCYNMTGDKGKGVRIEYNAPNGKTKKLMFSSLHHHTFAEKINEARRALGQDVPELLPSDEAIGLTEPFADLEASDDLAARLEEAEVEAEAVERQK